VVVIVRVAVPALAPVIFTGLVEPKLKVGGYWAPLGLEVMVAVSVTLPVKPPVGAMVIVDVFAVEAPAEIATVVPLIVRPGTGGIVTVTVAVPVDGL
jgi:hypothetical protein